MAINSSIHKVILHISNISQNQFQDYSLTLAKHPSETDERLMVRLAAFALYADEKLTLGKGVESEEEPALSKSHFDGSILLWIDIGLPKERRIRKAAARTEKIVVLAYGTENNVHNWFDENEKEFQKRKNLTVLQIPASATQALAKMMDKKMELSFMIENESMTVTGADQTVSLEIKTLMEN